jgi:hypothetical protein
MRDPVERMVKFVQQQQQQAAAEQARAAWVRRLPALLPCVEEVVEVFRRGLEEAAATPVVSVCADPRSEQWPLVILFAPRDPEEEETPRLYAGPARSETGASAVFRCGSDGIVRGIRYPFHEAARSVRPEQFADLGEPASVHPHRLGNAVADFLEWASVGDGCGRRKLRFGAAAVEVVPEPVRLSVVTAERAAA